MSERRTVSLLIEGRVQGVSYRAWTRDQAQAQGLIGTVRNRDDGAVEVVFSGSPDAVDRMVALCRAGPPGARVSDITVSELDHGLAVRGFEILRG